MRGPLLAFALCATSFGQTCGGGPAAGGEWTNLGGNSGRNGLTSTIGPASDNLLWSNTDDFSIIAWPPSVHDGRVFTVREAGFPQNGGAANDALVAYDLATGGELWRTTLAFAGDTNAEWIAWVCGARDGQVYASRSSHQKPQPVQAFDAATGAPLWTSSATSEAFAYDGVVFAPDGDLIVGDFASIARIDAATGATVWNTPRSCSVSGTCGAAATETALYIGEPAPGGNIVTKLDLATGAVLYSSPLMAGFTSQNTPFLSPDGCTVYYARSQNNPPFDNLHAFSDDGAQMVELWSRPIRWTTSHGQGIGPDGTIYAFTQAEEFVGLDPATGNVVYDAGVLAPLGSPNLSPQTAVGADGKVYVSNGWANNPATDGRMWAFTPDLTQNLFTLTLNRQNTGGPALAAGGVLVMCDRSGVHAYGDPRLGTSYCGPAVPNSTGRPGTLRATGSDLVADDDVVLVAEDLPPGQFGYFLASRDAGSFTPPGSSGVLCLSGNIGRYNEAAAILAGPAGSLAVDLGSIPVNPPTAVVPGDTWRFQCWYRDVGTSNFTDAVLVAFL